jgi:hypothetical protein
MRALILSCLFPVLAFAQITLQASGQTTSFALKAGAKAGWNNLVAPIGHSVQAQGSNSFRISMAGNRLFIRTGAKGMIRLVDGRGRTAATLAVEQDGFSAAPSGLAIGIYAAWFDAPGMQSRSAKLAVVR